MSLSGNTAKITELLSKINALPEAGSGGGSGGSVETCTVTVTTDSKLMLGYMFTTCVNGVIGSHSYLVNNNQPIAEPLVVESVVCGAPFHIRDYGTMFDGATITGGAELLTMFNYEYYFQAPASAGECTIHIKQD